MKKRKLIPKPILAEAYKRLQFGVPIARLIKDLNLDVSRPHMAILLDWYSLALQDEAICASLFPPWLEGETEQEEPDNAKYEGRFPFGVWL